MKSVYILVFLVLSQGLISACAIMDSPKRAAESNAEHSFPQLATLSEREREEAKDSKAWKKLLRQSQAKLVSDHRAEIKAEGALRGGIQKVEDTFLMRAAAETIREGYDGFIISYLTYESQFPIRLTNGFTSFPETVEIATYEEFLSYSKEQRIMMSASALKFKRIRGVIIMVQKDSTHYMNYFDADVLFQNFLGR